MCELKLIEAAKAGDSERVEALIAGGEAVDQRDDYGWTALNWAAGKGYTGIIQKLLDAGADTGNTGLDKRTAYKIALAAAHVESAALLQQAQQSKGLEPDGEARPYCKAYPVNTLRKFPAWRENQADLDDDAVLYLHEDFTVTLSMWPRENLVFDSRTPDWEAFCKQELAFSVPTDLDLAAVFAANRPVELHQASL